MSRTLKIVLATLYFLGQRTKTFLTYLIGNRPRPFCVTLCYHEVKKGDVARFERQVAFARRWGTLVSSDCTQPGNSRARHVAFTFDDALESFKRYAFPILQRHGVPSTLFVPTGYIGKGTGWIKDESHANFGEKVLSGEELVSLAEKGIRMGSHTVTHCRLAEADARQARRELTESKEALEALAGQGVSQLAFPYGSWSAEVAELARESGYKRVFRDIPLWGSDGFSSFVAGRITIDPDDWPLEYRLKILGAYRWQEGLVEVKKILMRKLRKNMPEKG